jgi:hypothetical protein
MSLRSLIALLTSVVAVGGLALVPTASVADTAGSATATSTATAAGTDDGTTDDSSTADDGTTDNSSAGDDTGALDPCSVSDVPDGGAAGDSSDSGFGDDTATDGDPGASAAQNTPDDQSGDAGDPMPPGGGDDTPGDTSDDNTCEDLGNGVSQDAPETVDNGEFSDGSLDVTYTLDQGGTVTATLTGNGASRRAVIAARHQTVYGRGHATSATGGKVKVRVRLTKAGRQAIRKARRTLHFTLRTHIALKDGSKVDHTKRITFKPATSKPKHKHRH